jgi:hypothetical protein
MSGTTSTGTITQFAPSAAGPFQFGVTLDGQDYTCIVTWGLWDQRWYLNIQNTSGAIVMTRALIASPPNLPINMLFGVFVTSTLVFFDATQTFVVAP